MRAVYAVYLIAFVKYEYGIRYWYGIPSSGPERVDGNIHTRTERYSMFGINRMRVINYQPSYPTDSSLVYPISYTVYLCCAARYLLFKKESSCRCFEQKESSCRCSERVELFRAGLA